MSVAALPLDAPVKPAAPRAENKHAKTGDEPASDFKSLVKGEPHRTSANAGGTENGANGEVESESGDRTGWRRWGTTLFDRHAAKLDPDAEKTEDAGSGDEAADEVLTIETDEAVGVVNVPATPHHKEKAPAKAVPHAQDSLADEAVTAKTIAADGGLVSAAAKNAQAPADAREATPGARPGEAAAIIGHKPEVQQRSTVQAVRPAGAEQAQAGTQSSASEIVLPRGDAGEDAAPDGDRGDGRNRDETASRFGQPQNGNRVSGVTVVSQQVTPALPAQPAGMTSTGAAFAASLAEGLAGTERTDIANQVGLAQAASKPGPVTVLKIQLSPVELGMVTARISGTEAQLSIEITVENAEARHRLSSDSDAIVTALRGLGIDVDRINVQQTQANSGSTPNGAGRGNEFAQQSGGRGEQQGQASQQGFERGRGGETHGGQGNAQSQNSGDGVYI
jgi:chemotaxis protein MotD